MMGRLMTKTTREKENHDIFKNLNSQVRRLNSERILIYCNLDTAK